MEGYHSDARRRIKHRRAEAAQSQRAAIQVYPILCLGSMPCDRYYDTHAEELLCGGEMGDFVLRVVAIEHSSCYSTYNR